MTLKERILVWYLARWVPKEAEKMFGKNWKTSCGGLGAILGGLGLLAKSLHDNTFDMNTVSQVLVAISGGIGLLKAKDFNVTGGDTAQTAAAKPTEAPIVATGPSAIKP